MTTEDDDEMGWLRDSGMTCSYDGEVIEYLDPVIVTLVVKPYIYEGRLTFYDVMTDDQDDYLYEPAFFHSKNWDEIEEQFQPYQDVAEALLVDNSIVDCFFCKSGILAGETMGIATFGEILRSQRDPDLRAFGNHFENMDANPRFICILCLKTLNDDVHEIWPDGVCHDDECPEGTAVRCWRDGCAGNCDRKEG